MSSAVAYTRAGIPASKLLMGIGVAPGYYDTSEAHVAAKVRYVEEHGLAGTLLWQPGNLKTDQTDPAHPVAADDRELRLDPRVRRRIRPLSGRSSRPAVPAEVRHRGRGRGGAVAGWCSSTPAEPRRCSRLTAISGPQSRSGDAD